MSQHDLNVDLDQLFPAAGVDLNNALAALGSNNSGATAPTATFAFMFWADTVNDLLKQRNAADSAWISILTLSTGVPVSGGNAAEIETIKTNVILNAFHIAQNGGFSIFNMVDSAVDDFKDESGINLTDSIDQFYNATDKLYSSVNSLAASTFSFTGGDQTYVVPAGITQITVKQWAPGGGGGGVGGGGGFVEEIISVTPLESLTIKIGGGGVFEGAGASAKGGGGGLTGIFRGSTLLTCAGGGGGGSVSSGQHGGPGGGEIGGNPSGGTGDQAAGGTQIAGGDPGTGGGSGSSLTGGDSADGASNDAAGGYNGGGKGDGDNVNFTSGGGGAGLFGGGSGGNTSSNNGGGGGGSSKAPAGTNTQASGQTVANGGDVDYPGSVGNGGPTSANGQNGYAVILPSSVNDITLYSNSQTAETQPDESRIVLVQGNAGSGAFTVNTDLKVFVSRESGAVGSITWAQVTLVDEGLFAINEQVLVGLADISAQVAGTTMRWKVQTLNGKEIDLYRIANQWG